MKLIHLGEEYLGHTGCSEGVTKANEMSILRKEIHHHQYAAEPH